MTRKVIPASAPDAFRPWQLPDVAGGEVAEREARTAAPGVIAPGRPPTAGQLEAVQKAAREEGYALGFQEGRSKGYAEGRQLGEREVHESAASLKNLLRALSAPLAEMDERIEEALVSLAISVAKHLVRRELKADPRQVIAVVREAMGALPVVEEKVHIYMNPEDAMLVRDVLALHEEDTQWHLVEDPVITRGGCRVVTDSSRVDATVEGRVAAVVAKVMGDERDGDHGE